MPTKLLDKYALCLVGAFAGEIEKKQPRLNIEVEGDGVADAFEAVINSISSWGSSQLFVITNGRNESVVHVVSVDEIKVVITMDVAQSVVSIVDPGSTKGVTIDTDDESTICITCWGGSEPLIELLQQKIPSAVVFSAN
jgi:hypothetical protein